MVSGNVPVVSGMHVSPGDGDGGLVSSAGICGCHIGDGVDRSDDGEGGGKGD